PLCSASRPHRTTTSERTAMAHPTSSPRPTAPQDRDHPAPAGSPPAPPGTYQNPILDEDWPDPDVIRFGGEYVMIASSFNRAPGLPVLRSRDLVSWEIVAHALPAVPPQQHFALPRHGSGGWAPRSEEHTSERQSRFDH